MKTTTQLFDELAQVVCAFSSLEKLIQDDDHLAIIAQLNIRMAECVSNLDLSLHSL